MGGHLDRVKRYEDSPHLVKQDRQRGENEEHGCLCLIGCMSCKALADNAMPIRAILSIEEGFDVPRDVLLVLELSHGS